MPRSEQTGPILFLVASTAIMLKAVTPTIQLWVETDPAGVPVFISGQAAPCPRTPCSIVLPRPGLLAAAGYDIEITLGNEPQRVKKKLTVPGELFSQTPGNAHASFRWKQPVKRMACARIPVCAEAVYVFSLIRSGFDDEYFPNWRMPDVEFRIKHGQQATLVGKSTPPGTVQFKNEKGVQIPTLREEDFFWAVPPSGLTWTALPSYPNAEPWVARAKHDGQPEGDSADTKSDRLYARWIGSEVVGFALWLFPERFNAIDVLVHISHESK